MTTFAGASACYAKGSCHGLQKGSKYYWHNVCLQSVVRKEISVFLQSVKSFVGICLIDVVQIKIGNQRKRSVQLDMYGSHPAVCTSLAVDNALCIQYMVWLHLRCKTSVLLAWNEKPFLSRFEQNVRRNLLCKWGKVSIFCKTCSLF